MKINIKFLIATMFAIVGLGVNAQMNNSAYFIEGYLYRYQANPALGNDSTSFISMPGIGNLSMGVNGTLSLDDILYNVNGETTTFMNPAVDASSFLDAIGSNNRMGAGARIGLLAAGFNAFNGYNTVSLNIRSNLKTRIPSSFFSLLKEGVENKTYDISDMSAHADLYAELALGHSHKLNDKWRLGATLKFLIGGANIDAQFTNAYLTLGEDSWNAVVDAKVQSSVKGLTYEQGQNDRTGHKYVDGMDVDGTGVNGFGLAVDLGAEFKLNNDWTFSASVLDLGFINWNNNMLASTNGSKSFSTDKYTFNVDEDASNSFDNQWDKMGDDLAALYELEDMGDQGSRSKMLGATVNIGAQYTLPIYRKLSLGLLNTTYIQGDYTATEFRLSANVNPIKPFSAGINVATGTYGWAFGWIMNVNTKGFNMFVGMDHLLTKLAKQGVPLSSNADFSLGINFPF